jgi:hypothetical protein
MIRKTLLAFATLATLGTAAVTPAFAQPAICVQLGAAPVYPIYQPVIYGPHHFYREFHGRRWHR